MHTRQGSLDRRHLGAILTVLLLLALVVGIGAWTPLAHADEGVSLTTGLQADEPTARPSTTGQPRVTGVNLTDAQGNPIVLRGVSTHGLQWFPQYVNDSLFHQLSTEWNCNLVRLVLYSQDYCDGNEEQRLEVLRQGIEACIANDMYVLVDWHILDDGDPNQNIEQAKAFFTRISSEYANVPNLLYEICNEPNGETTWSDIHAYADEVIPLIRANSPEAVIIVGTPVYDRELLMASRDPLGFDNVMYTLHFYVTTHREDLRGELTAALEAGLPVFVTECGLSEASGDGRLDFDSAIAWFELLEEHDISFTIWSLSNKAETSAFIRSTSEATTQLSDKDLTPVGLWARALIQGRDPASIPLPALDDEGYLIGDQPSWMDTLDSRGIRSARAWTFLASGALVAILAATAFSISYKRRLHLRPCTYDDLIDASEGRAVQTGGAPLAARAAIFASTLFTLIYLIWRVCFSVPTKSGWIAIAGNLILLAVEALGFVESLIHYQSMVGLRQHPLPKIADEDYPDVDIFIATYNEPIDLLRRTINGCNHLRYPDKSKVHVWVCDDNRRPQMRELAEQMGVGYFDRPDNEGAKAGNLNHAMGLTSAPYVVTLDADMIVRRDFLLKTIPYFVDAEHRNALLPEDQRVHLGLLQTPQSFYDPDVFQFALYSENRTTNEQDFFYRTIEVAKTSTNSVIYGGSNTVLSRAALEAAGGFFTGSITEDFATGILIESAGFVSLAIPEPLASGRTPHTFKEHIQQRTRWGRGVIVTARKLHLTTRKGLSLEQRLSYWSSVIYWYSPIKNLIYIAAPLMFAVFNLPVFACSWLDLLIYWLPMFLAQNLCLRVVSQNAVSSKWSGIHETSVMPHLFIPIVKELLGITLSTFKVTDKSGKGSGRTVDLHSMAPFIVLLVLSLIGIVRVTWLLVTYRTIGSLVVLFWLIRNAYFIVMSLFLIDGRDSDGEPVRVIGAEPVMVERKLDGESSSVYEGVATVLTEHSVRVYLDDANDLGLGDPVSITIDNGTYRADLRGAVVGLVQSRSGRASVHSIEVLDYGDSELEFMQILYDRIPSLPQALTHDFGILADLWRNIAYRVARTVR